MAMKKLSALGVNPPPAVTALGLCAAAGSHRSSPSPREPRTGLGKGGSELGEEAEVTAGSTRRGLNAKPAEPAAGPLTGLAARWLWVLALCLALSHSASAQSSKL